MYFFAKRQNKLLLIIFCFTALLVMPCFVWADSLGQAKNFFVENDYDIQKRQQVAAVLKQISQKAYFYLEGSWYDNLSQEQKNQAQQQLIVLGSRFDTQIYPKLTEIFGPEWSPGIDNDERVTIFFHQLKEGAAGYFRTQDEAPKLQADDSNEREMIFINADFLFDDIIKSLLAHEFVHLIEYNQKERLRGQQEEIWLSEMRAEIAPSLLGYDADYQGSNLQKRVKTFVESPNDSLIEWLDSPGDYGVANLFGQYLLDRYGAGIFVDSLHSSQKGIASLEEAFVLHNIPKSFSRIFSDWLVTVFLNDCRVFKDYCYQNQNLKNLKIVPSLILLPAVQQADFSLNYNTPPWAGNWYRIMGGLGDLEVKFSASPDADFQVYYILCSKNQECSVSSLTLNNLKQGSIGFEDFSSKWNSLTLIPFIVSKSPVMMKLSYNFSIFVQSSFAKAKARLIEELKTKISEVQAQIKTLQQQLAALQWANQTCSSFQNDLFLGLSGAEVKCLQVFLKNQGTEIYPESLVTGFFGFATKGAVVRFQEKHYSEILAPAGLTKGNGYFGYFTRQKTNQLLSMGTQNP